MSNDKQWYFSLQFLNRAHTWIGVWLIREAVTGYSKYLTFYWISSTLITSYDKQRYIIWMEMNLDQIEWIHVTPFRAHVNDANWCPIFLSSWIEEKVDYQLKVSKWISLLISVMGFSIHGSPSYQNTLITKRRYVIIQVNLLLSSCHLSAYNQSVLYIPRQDSTIGFSETFVTVGISISYAISKR